ncbi:MAG: outer membrane beta-barrel protein [Opitutaceae bacterium]|nr:outer membrane beta-barrel protein [Opitutaceae bacterium]
MNTTPSPVLFATALLVSAFVLPTTACAFAEIERGSLTLSTTGRVAYDSNVAGHDSAQGDTVYTLAPTLNYSRAAGLGTIAASLGVAINRYADLSTQDSEDISSSLHISLPTPEGAREQGSFSAGYTDASDIDDSVGQRIRSKTWKASFVGTYRVGTRVNLNGSLSYSDTTRAVFTDRTQFGAGLGFDYSDFLGGFGLNGDYRYADTQSSSFTSGRDTSIDQTSHSVSSGLFYRFVSGLRASANVGYRWLDRGASETLSGQTGNNGMTIGIKLDGPFLPPSRFPKLKSSFAIGLQKGEALGLNDSGSTTLVGNLSLGWQARERTALTFSASRTQGLSTANESSVDNVVQLGATQRIGERTSLSAQLGQEWSTYPTTGRSDRRTRGSVSLGYSLNRYWRTGADYSVTLTHSSNSLLTYDRHVVSAYVNYTF